jgi:hypothetical protein
MFDTIIMLMGNAEQSVMGAVLRGHNPFLNILSVETAAELVALNDGVLARARLIAFVTPVVVPPNILANLSYGAFNFHPGHPITPGGHLHILRFTSGRPNSVRPSMSWSRKSMRDRSSMSRGFPSLPIFRC